MEIRVLYRNFGFKNIENKDIKLFILKSLLKFSRLFCFEIQITILLKRWTGFC